MASIRNAGRSGLPSIFTTLCTKIRVNIKLEECENNNLKQNLLSLHMCLIVQKVNDPDGRMTLTWTEVKVNNLFTEREMQ